MAREGHGLSACDIHDYSLTQLLYGRGSVACKGCGLSACNMAHGRQPGAFCGRAYTVSCDEQGCMYVCA